MPLTQPEQEHGTDLPLPLQQYLNHAWSTEGLVGAVPWIADFLRMMKWDIVSMQVNDLAVQCSCGRYACLQIATPTDLCLR